MRRIGTRLQLRPLHGVSQFPGMVGLTDWLILDPDHPLASNQATIQWAAGFPGRVILLQRESTTAELVDALPRARRIWPRQIDEAIVGTLLRG